jgi:hypothetical protein
VTGIPESAFRSHSPNLQEISLLRPKFAPTKVCSDQSLLRHWGKTFIPGSFLNHENSASERRGARFTMKSPLVIVLGALALFTVTTLAVMNKTCKSSQHAWCAPMRHHMKFGRS